MALDLGGLLQAGGNLAAVESAYSLPQEGIDVLKGAQSELLPKIEQLASDVSSTATFKPFSVRTGTGSTDVGQTGDVTMSLSDQLSGLASQLQGQASTMAGQAPVTAQGLFEQLQSMRAGETERAQLALENRLAAQGRLGTQTAAYGGTPEALAMNKAIQEQQSADMFQAMQLAPQLQQQNLANVGAALGTSFMPEQQMLGALGAGTNVGNLVQAARQGQTEAQAQLGSAGIASEAELYRAISGLESARAGAYSDALQGLFATQDNGTSQIQTILEALGL